MDLLEHMTRREESIIHELLSVQAGIDNRTGKGTTTERIVEKNLILPNLPPRFRATKGTVISRDSDLAEAKAID
jgi:hypothetical protein